MSEDAERKMKRDALVNKMVSFGVCSGLLLLFAGILYFTILIIKGEVAAEFIAYTPPTEDGPPTNTPVQRELSSKSSAPTPEVTPSVIVAQDAVSVVAAPLSFDTTGDFSFDDLSVSLDMGTGIGEGLGNGGSGLGSGSPGGSSLEGTFYDLKMTRSGAPSKIPDRMDKDAQGNPFRDKNGKAITKLKVSNGRSGHEFDGELSRFFARWSEGTLSAYYRSATKLYASNFYLPSAQSGYAPKAFRCDDVSQPGGWICVYRGRVKAPKTGKFRFVGAGDEFLVVRFNKQKVLEAGYHHPSLWQKDNPAAVFTYGPEGATGGGWKKFWNDVKAGKHKDFAGYELITNIPNIPRWNNELGGMTAGKVFEVKEGQVYPIEVAVGDIDGMMGFVLLIEDVTNGKTPAGQKLDLFRTNFSTPDVAGLKKLLRGFMDGNELQAPPYNEDSPIWVAVP